MNKTSSIYYSRAVLAFSCLAASIHEDPSMGGRQCTIIDMHLDKDGGHFNYLARDCDFEINRAAKVARTQPDWIKKKKKYRDNRKRESSLNEMHKYIWRRCAQRVLSLFLLRCRRWYAACLFRFAMQLFSLFLSLFSSCSTSKTEERKRERECLQHTLRVTHTAAPSINRCVCCFNLPWARDQRDKGQISAKIVCETCRQTRWWLARTYKNIGQVDESGNRRANGRLTRTTRKRNWCFLLFSTVTWTF